MSPKNSPASQHPGTANILRWFDDSHLPPHLQAVVGPIRQIAETMASAFPHGGPELTVGLRKLLEGKDCLVRVAVAEHAKQSA